MTKPLSTTGRRRLVLLAAFALTAATIVAPAQAAPPQAIAEAPEVRATPTDSLWVATGYGKNAGFAVCADPTSSQALDSCFAQVTNAPTTSFTSATTDGINVYFAGSGGGLSCRISDLGAKCSHIMAGSWGEAPRPYTVQNYVTAVAASGGELWLGQNNGAIYRCPNNLPYVNQKSMPSECVLLDTARSSVDSMLLANGTLYVGVGANGIEARNQGFIWACDPQEQDSCTTLDTLGNNYPGSMAVGAGYLWVGLGAPKAGLLWRCDVSTVNGCDNWDTPGYGISSVSYGAGTVYAAVSTNMAKQPDGVIWSCSTAQPDGCSNVLTGIESGTVAAGAQETFSSNYQGSNSTLSYGTNPYTKATAQGSPWQSMLYVPATGPTGVGELSAQVKPTRAGRGLKRDCTDRGGNPTARITVKGPHGISVARTVDLCQYRRGQAVKAMFDLLDPGTYTVTATAKRAKEITRVTVQKDRTTAVTIILPRAAWRR